MAMSRPHRFANPKRRLAVEALEDRRMMAVLPVVGDFASYKELEKAPMTVIPALSSLPGAAKTIFLDFDGDFQSVWNRTDSNQTYRNVSVGASNLSAADMRKVWETVAEDYAPFNVNVTTVQPGSFADNVALRVVIAGNTSAQLVTGRNTTVNLAGNRFITDDGGATLLDTSGYAALNSFTNGEPNVVYVFGQYMSTSAWGTTSPEGHTRTLAALLANTASHEAGHAFGLAHHTGVDSSGNASNYHVGGAVTTPIMGDNTAGDRTLWSIYNVGSTGYDSIGRLTTTLGARPDDHGSGTWFARPLTFTSSFNGLTTTATTSGVIEKTSDQDWFKFSTAGAGVSFNLNTVEFANLDAKLEVFKMVPTPFGLAASLIASIDGPTLFGAPFSGLGASYGANLAAGDYMVAVKSHGGYSDLGNYTLTVTQNSLRVVTGGVYGSYATYSTETSKGSTTPVAVKGATLASGKSAGGLGQSGDARRAMAVDAIYSAWTSPTNGVTNVAKPISKTADFSDARVWENLDGFLGIGARLAA